MAFKIWVMDNKKTEGRAFGFFMYLKIGKINF